MQNQHESNKNSLMIQKEKKKTAHFNELFPGHIWAKNPTHQAEIQIHSQNHKAKCVLSAK